MPQPSDESVSTHPSISELPSLYHDRSYWGLAATQFLGAFNDNLFKQLMLLLATPAAIAVAGVAQPPDRQSEAMIVFASGFLLFSGFAGYLADKYSKRRVIVLSKIAEIVVMTTGLVAFFCYDWFDFSGLLLVLFFMGLQSTFFGPAKYGILPETLRARDLPRGNGIFMMLTFLAIIFGTAIAGALLWLLEGANLPVWPASLVCIGIAIVGTQTALLVRRVPPVDPHLRFRWRSVTVPQEIIGLLRCDRELFWALIVASMFWMLGGIVQQTVNALGKTQLGLADWQTSLMAAMIGIGIAIGCMLGGYLSAGKINARVVATGASGIVACLLLMSLPGGPRGHLLQFQGSIPVLIALGIFTGMFVVPVQVVLQMRPPKSEKGRMIAVANLATNVGIIFGAVIYKISIGILDGIGGPRSAIFAVTAAIMLPVALFYRPQDEVLA